MIYITSGRERQARPVEQKPQNTPPRLPGLSARRATSREWTDLASPTTAAGQLLQHIDTMLVATSARQERAAWLNAIKATSVLTANNISLLLARAGRGHDGEPREESFRRARLLEALAHAPSSSHVVPSLTTMLTNKSNLTRTFAAMALAQMGPNAAESSQDLTALLETNWCPTVVHAAWQALGGIAPVQAMAMSTRTQQRWKYLSTT